MGDDNRISASVGLNGRNLRADVLTVQNLLMDCVGTYGPLRPFTPDGLCGPITIATIQQFQRNAVMMPSPDGRVDPGGKTLKLLIARANGTGPNSGPPAPSVVPPTPSGSPAVDISQAGVQFIGDHEGLVLKLYDDQVGYATIGYGHLVHKSRVGTDPASEAPYVNGITKVQALALLRSDAAIHVHAVRAAVQVPLTQNQFDALVCLSFNIGGGALKTSTLVKIINQGNATPDQIRTAFCMWNKAGGKILKALQDRRNDEASLYNDGEY